jgi:cobalt/nickel transport system ATP-binding protein
MNSAIIIQNLGYIYPDGQIALKGINLSIKIGESVALIGPNGAGKSTLLQHLNGIIHGNNNIKILGKTLSQRNLSWVRQKVGLIFQNPDDQLFSPTVFEDVAFGPLNLGFSLAEVQEKVKQALCSVGMQNYEKRSPYHLSLGEKKRIAIATVLSMQPDILVLDEPTSSLDPRSKWALVRLLQSLPQTKIVATHDLDVVSVLCERTIILDRGSMAADGNTSDILADKELLIKHGLAEDCRF